MVMLKIYLARHGQDEDNVNGILNGHRDKPLTKLGESQAQELAEKIKSLNLTFDKVYASPLQRAYKTAEIVTKKLNIESPEVMNDLIERDFGIMTGKKHIEIEILSPHVLKTETVTYFLDPEKAETFANLKIRGKKILEHLKKSHIDGNILLVTHGDIGKMIYAAYYDLDWEKVLKMFHFGNSDLLLLSENSSPTDAHIVTIGQHNL